MLTVLRVASKSRCECLSHLENEYKAVLNAGYAEKQQLCTFPGAVNTVGDTVYNITRQEANR